MYVCYYKIIFLSIYIKYDVKWLIYRYQVPSEAFETNPRPIENAQFLDDDDDDRIIVYVEIPPWGLLSHSLDRPLLLAQRATIVLFDPKGHAAIMERVVALAPDDHAVLSTVNLLLTLRLASQTGVWKSKNKKKKRWRLAFAYRIGSSV